MHFEIWLTLGAKAERCEIQPRDTYGCPRARELREARPTSTADQRHPVKRKHTLESYSQNTPQLSESHLGEKDDFLLRDGAGEDGVMTAVGGQRAAILLASEDPDSSLAFSSPPKR